jgi:hypothetical protein
MDRRSFLAGLGTSPMLLEEALTAFTAAMDAHADRLLSQQSPGPI